MLLETIAFSGILYVGFKKFVKSNEMKQFPSKTILAETTITEINVADDKLRQTVEETNNNQPQKIHKNVNIYEHKNDRDIVIALFGLALSTIGVLFYWPLSILSIPFFVYASRRAHLNTYHLTKQGKIGIESLITITITGCIITGHFFVVNLIVILYRVAAKLTAMVTQDSKQKLFDTFGQHANFVWILIDGTEIRVPFHNLQAGDVAMVHAGEIIPADGIIIEGMASVDQHILTGEARPIDKGLGEEVFAATVVLSGKIHVKVKKAGEETTVAKITNILNRTIDFKSSVQLRAETLSEKLVVPTLLVSGIALPILGFGGALAVINTHPKNKLMIIAPLTILNYLNLASKQGILIKDGRSLELLPQVDTIIFDKTGTLTEEQPHIGTIHSCSSYGKNDILIYAATAEYKQKHPLAKAILQEAKNRELSVLPIEDSEYKLGYGIAVYVDGKTIYVGSERFMDVEGITIPSRIKQQQNFCHEQGYTLVIVAIDSEVIGAIELLPTVRPEAQAVIDSLKQRPNIKATYIISGDHETPTQKLAQELGIDHYFAETLPENKANIIEQLQQQGHFICYIGDGINDSIALKKSQVSISLRGASTIATDTANIILMDQGLSHLNPLFDLADKFHANLNRTFAMMIIPSIIGVSGAFLVGFTIVQTLILNMIGLVLAVGNAMIPLLTVQPTKPTKQIK
jgi:heavy metal translocating P-type ATPase